MLVERGEVDERRPSVGQGGQGRASVDEEEDTRGTILHQTLFTITGGRMLSLRFIRRRGPSPESGSIDTADEIKLCHRFRVKGGGALPRSSKRPRRLRRGGFRCGARPSTRF